MPPVSQASQGLGHLCSWLARPIRKGGFCAGREPHWREQILGLTDGASFSPLASRNALLWDRPCGGKLRAMACVTSQLWTGHQRPGGEPGPGTLGIGSVLYLTHHVSPRASTFGIRPPPPRADQLWREYRGVRGQGACTPHGMWHPQCSAHWGKGLGEGVHPETCS